jgi:hypothetical protein
MSIISAINTLVDTLSLSDVKKLSKRVNRLISYSIQKSASVMLKEMTEQRAFRKHIYANFEYINYGMYGWVCSGRLILNGFSYYRSFGHYTKKQSKELVCKSFLSILNYHDYHHPQSFQFNCPQGFRDAGASKNPQNYTKKYQQSSFSSSDSKYKSDNDTFWKSLSNKQKREQLDHELDLYQSERGY